MAGESAVERFKEIASEERFKGWPMVGEVDYPDLALGRIPFFGRVMHYSLATSNGVEDYYSIERHFGWAVVFGVTKDSQVVTLVQWKPGVNQASWELPPGGIGRVESGAAFEEILSRVRDVYLRETGYGGGEWSYLGRVLIETGKYRGAGPEDHGLPAHLYLATNLEVVQEARSPNPNEIMETLLVSLEEFEQVIDSGLFVEESALSCALLALRRLAKDKSF